MAVNSWMLPPVVGYSTEVSQGAVKSLSDTSFANLAAKRNHLVSTMKLILRFKFAYSICTYVCICVCMCVKYEGNKRNLHCPDGGEKFKSIGSTQSYDFICIVPSKSLLKTVISGWLCRGITAVGGRKKRHNCTKEGINQSDNIMFICNIHIKSEGSPLMSKNLICLPKSFCTCVW